VEQYAPYAMEQWQAGVPISFLVKPLDDLYAGVAGAKRWRKSQMELQDLVKETKDASRIQHNWIEIGDLSKDLDN